MDQKTLVVVGAGAAGFFSAVTAARLNPDLKVMLVEKTSKVLSKVKVSGGGRCNVTHACFEIADMIKFYPRGTNFLKKSFYQFFTTDTIEWFNKRNVKLKTESDGRMFPESNSSQTIIDCLMKELNETGVELLLNHDLDSLKKEDRWILQFRDRTIECDFVCIATGGFPKLSMFDWITLLGHKVSEPVPSLFTFNSPNDPIKSLMGVSVPNAQIRIRQTGFRQQGPLLITHWGVSGPVVLRSSAWQALELARINYRFEVLVNWVGDMNEQDIRESLQEQRSTQPGQKVQAKNPLDLPSRLWEFLVERSGIQKDLRWCDLPSALLNKLVQHLFNYELKIEGKTTFKEEFVTAGGVSLKEIDPQTMQSRIHKGLFFAGEIMDVDGVTGGFNFQHAWTSGFIAGKSIAEG